MLKNVDSSISLWQRCMADSSGIVMYIHLCCFTHNNWRQWNNSGLLFFHLTRQDKLIYIFSGDENNDVMAKQTSHLLVCCPSGRGTPLTFIALCSHLGGGNSGLWLVPVQIPTVSFLESPHRGWPMIGA